MKKLNKFFAILVALAMMAVLCVTAAFAETTTYDADDAALTKYLQKGEGVDAPGATYNFSIHPITAGAPDAVNTSIAESAMTPDRNEDLVGSLTVADIFDGVEWPSTGVYEYTVTEIAATKDGAAWNEDADPNDTLTIDSDASYTLRVYIKSINGEKVIDGVTVQEGTGDADDDAKVDPTDNPEIADDGIDENGDNVGFTFTNTYKKNLVTNDDDANGILNVEKEVVGDYADKTYEFSFDLAYTKPTANPDGAIKYRVDKVVNGTLTQGAVQTYTGNSPLHADLKDGEKLVIVAIPQGTDWSVTENLTAATVQNRDKYVATATKPNNNPTEGNNLVTNKANLTEATSVKVTNTLPNTTVSPTGILISNLPYIALALVAVGGLVAYVVVRRKDEDNA